MVFAKLNRPARPDPVARADSPTLMGRRFIWFDAMLLLALVSSTAVIWSRMKEPPPSERSTTASRPPESALRASGAPSTPTTTPEHVTPLDPPTTLPAPNRVPEQPIARPPRAALPSGLPVPLWSTADPVLPPEDRALLEPLLRVVASRSEVEESHIRQAEELHIRHPGHASMRQALEGLFELAARQAHEKGHPLDAVRYRVRATELWPETPGIWLRLIQYHEETRAWRDAELAARRAVSACPDAASLHKVLAGVLVRQGRDQEAADVLRGLLTRHDDVAVRNFLAQLEAQLGSVANLTRQTSLHFGVRFEGEPDNTLGQALLKVLEEKHEMLSRILDFVPEGQVQVILYPRETFRSVSTSPGWAGGYYDHSDGRIRIGTRDLSAGFVPLDLERTLTHELTHAFLAWRTRGLTPRDINEGLAQYLSGRRLGYRLAASRAVARNGSLTVDDFYDAALSFVEFLLDRYRQASMNVLLETLGTTGDVDKAFRRACGQSYQEAREEWLKQLQ